MNLNELLPKGVAPVREAVPSYHVAELRNPMEGIANAFGDAAVAVSRIYGDAKREEEEAELGYALVEAGNYITACKTKCMQTSGLNSANILGDYDSQVPNKINQIADSLQSDRAADIFLTRIREVSARNRAQVEMHHFEEMKKANLEEHKVLAAQKMEAAASAPIPQDIPPDTASEVETKAWYILHYGDLFDAEYEIRNAGTMQGKSPFVINAEVQELRDTVFSAQIKRLADAGNFDKAESLIKLYRENPKLPSISAATLKAAEHSISLRQQVKREQDVVTTYFTGYDDRLWENPEAYSPNNELALVKKEFGQKYSGEKRDRLIARAEREIYDRDRLFAETRKRCSDQKLFSLADGTLQQALDGLAADPTFTVGDRKYPMTKNEVFTMRTTLTQIKGEAAGTSQSNAIAREAFLRELGKNLNISLDQAKKIFVDNGGNINEGEAKFIKDMLKTPYGKLDQQVRNVAKSVGLKDVPWGFYSVLMTHTDLNDLQTLSDEKIRSAMCLYVNGMARPADKTVWQAVSFQDRDMHSPRHDWSDTEEYSIPFTDQQAKACYYAIRRSLDAAYGSEWHHDSRATQLFFTPWEKLTKSQKVEFVRDFCAGTLE